MKSSRFPRYNTEEEKLKRIEPLQPFRPVPREELRCTTAELNYGMGHSAVRCSTRLRFSTIRTCHGT